MFAKGCENVYSVGLKLHIVKEKLALYIESRFEAYKSYCRRNHVEILSGLKDTIKSRASTFIVDFIESTKLSSWNESWWAYARIYSKTPTNCVEYDVEQADPLTFLQVVTSCSLFPDKLRSRAVKVIKVQNLFSHSPIFQVNTIKLRYWFYIIEKLEVKLIP